MSDTSVIEEQLRTIIELRREITRQLIDMELKLKDIQYKIPE